MSRYSRNTAKVCVKHQSINQSIKQMSDSDEDHLYMEIQKPSTVRTDLFIIFIYCFAHFFCLASDTQIKSGGVRLVTL
jgi:hypothetical protein